MARRFSGARLVTQGGRCCGELCYNGRVSSASFLPAGLQFAVCRERHFLRHGHHSLLAPMSIQPVSIAFWTEY